MFFSFLLSSKWTNKGILGTERNVFVCRVFFVSDKRAQSKHQIQIPQVLILKGTNVLSPDFSGLPCLLQLYTGYICRITVNFGTMKDGNRLINSFASSNCFSNRNIFQNGVHALSKINDTFLTKS